MATFTITTPVNIDSLVGKTGADVYNINGGELTIDQDTRYGTEQNTSAHMGSITVSATLGGKLKVDARKVRYIPYDTGSGNVPASNTVITQGGAIGKLICVQSSLTAAPTAAGAAMPASGFIKVKQWNDVAYAAGALAGIGANATGPDVVGCIELVGREASTLTANRLGTVEFLGEWYDLGTTSGTANQTFQYPTNGSLVWLPGVWIETAVGSGLYDFYANAGTTTAISADIRGQVVWCTTAGLIRLGHNGTGNAGYTPIAGLKVRIPNINCQNTVTATPTVNSVPNGTLDTRYEFATTGGGVLSMDKVLCAWYMNFSQAYSLNISRVGTFDAIIASETATFMTWTECGVGLFGAALNVAFTSTISPAGAQFTRCHFVRASLASSGVYISNFTGVTGFTFTDCRWTSYAFRANTNTGAAQFLSGSSSITLVRPRLIGGRVVFSSSSVLTVTDASYAETPNGTTSSTNAISAISFGACNDTLVSGFDFFGLTNVHPYTSIVTYSSNCARAKVRNIGSLASPLNLGSASACGNVINLGTSAGGVDLKCQRVHVINSRSGVWSIDNSLNKYLVENCSFGYPAMTALAALNMIVRGVGANISAPATTTGVYGTHWFDTFSSSTAGYIGIYMNEATVETASQIALTNGASFTSAGGLYMPTIGMTAEFTMPYFAIGHTGFTNTALLMTGGTASNHTYAWQADTGSGFSAWSSERTAAQLGTDLSALSVNPAIGVKLKLRITTSVTNTAAITHVRITTTTTTAAQTDNLYPLDTNTLTITGLQTGSDVVIYDAGTTTILGLVDANGTSSWAYTYSGADVVDVGIFKAGFVPLYIRNLSLTTTDSNLPVAQVADRAYLE